MELLHGVAAIAARLFPEEEPSTARRRVYHWIRSLPPDKRLPVFKIGETICARPEALAQWALERERHATPDQGNYTT